MLNSYLIIVSDHIVKIMKEDGLDVYEEEVMVRMKFRE